MFSLPGQGVAQDPVRNAVTGISDGCGDTPQKKNCPHFRSGNSLAESSASQISGTGTSCAAHWPFSEISARIGDAWGFLTGFAAGWEATLPGTLPLPPAVSRRAGFDARDGPASDWFRFGTPATHRMAMQQPVKSSCPHERRHPIALPAVIHETAAGST